MFVCVYVCVRVCACVFVCMCVCVFPYNTLCKLFWYDCALLLLLFHFEVTMMSYSTISPRLHWNGIKEDKVILQARTNNRTNSSDTAHNATLGHPGCLIPRTQDFVPWDNPDSIISFHAEDIVRRVKEDVFFAYPLSDWPACHRHLHGGVLRAGSRCSHHRVSVRLVVGRRFVSYQ